MPPSPAAHRHLRVPTAHRGNRVHPPQLHPRVPGQRGAEGEGEWARGAPRGQAGGTALLEGPQPPGEAVRGVGALFFFTGVVLVRLHVQTICACCTFSCAQRGF